MQSRSLFQRFKDKYSSNVNHDGSNKHGIESGLLSCESLPLSTSSSELPPQPTPDKDKNDQDFSKFHLCHCIPLQLSNFIRTIRNSNSNHSTFQNKHLKHRNGGISRVRSLFFGSLLCSMLSLLAFHPPCRRKRARYSPVCVIARELGLSEPLTPTNNQLKVFLPRQERSRLLLGIFTVGNDPQEQELRQAIRTRLLNDPINDKRNVTCSLEEFIHHRKQNKYCKIVYTFVLGGNEEGYHLAFNKTYPSELPYRNTSLFAERFRGHQSEQLQNSLSVDVSFEEQDVTFVNVRDVNDVRKVWAWYDYTTKVRMEKGRRFDYVGVMMDTSRTTSSRTRWDHRVLDPAALLTSILRPRTTTPKTYAGIERSKSDCGGVNATWSCPRLQPDAYISGDLMVLSNDLVDYCLTHNNLIQLNGVYPQDRPDIALANLLSLHPKGVNRTHLTGVVVEVNNSSPLVSRHLGANHSTLQFGRH